jgi:aldose 1-epimerase
MDAASGEQIELELGDQRAVIVEVGAGLREYSAAGRPIIDGYAADAVCDSGRGQLLMPWPNRIDGGSYDFDGQSHQLALDEPERRNAIHGLVRWAAWTVAERAADRVRLEHRLHPSPGYPFALALGVEYALTADGLSVLTEATNVGADACPYGSGAHPYLAVPGDRVDDITLQVPAQTTLQADERGLPVGSVPVEGELDFRTPKPVGEVKLDHCFTDLVRDEDGLARVRLGETTLWADESYPYLMIFTGDPLPVGARGSLAVEPMTCAPNAFRSSDGLVRLEPGQTHAGVWGITPR